MSQNLFSSSRESAPKRRSRCAVAVQRRRERPWTNGSQRQLGGTLDVRVLAHTRPRPWLTYQRAFRLTEQQAVRKVTEQPKPASALAHGCPEVWHGGRRHVCLVIRRRQPSWRQPLWRQSCGSPSTTIGVNSSQPGPQRPLAFSRPYSTTSVVGCSVAPQAYHTSVPIGGSLPDLQCALSDLDCSLTNVHSAQPHDPGGLCSDRAPVADDRRTQ